MWSMNVVILLLLCYGTLHFSPTVYALACSRKVCFNSTNFNNILQWEPVKPKFPGERVLYSVSYWSDVDEDFKIKKECQNIPTLSCDLTAETPSVEDVYYQARVFINGILYDSTERLKPLAHTVLGPPTLFTFTTVSTLHVNVTLPLGPNGVSLEDLIINSKKWPVENPIKYTLNFTTQVVTTATHLPPASSIASILFTPAIHPIYVEISTSGYFNIRLKNFRTKYCGYVFYQTSEWGSQESEKAYFCETLKGDHKMLLPWPAMSVALVAAIVIILVVCLLKHVRAGKKHRVPESLVIIPAKVVSVLVNPDTNLVSKPMVCAPTDQIVYATIRGKPIVQPGGGYFPQDEFQKISSDSPADIRVERSTPNHEDTSSQTSEIYSSVAVNVTAGETGDRSAEGTDEGQPGEPALTHKYRRQNTHDYKANPQLALQGVDGCDVVTQLLLQTVRDTNGKLVLPSLTSHLLEGQPFLSDIIDDNAKSLSVDSIDWSDSGCDSRSHYSHTQLPIPNSLLECQDTLPSQGNFEASYRPNWVLEIPPRTLSSDNYCRTLFSVLQKGAGWEEEPRQIALDDLFVQEQESFAAL